MCICIHAWGRGHLFLVQVLKVVHTCAFVHMLRDVDTCFWCKCFRSSIHVRLYPCLGTLQEMELFFNTFLFRQFIKIGEATRKF
jgi:hypothetical protein